VPTVAVGLFSGGLDSQLAILMMQKQGIHVTALHAVHPFHPRRGLTTEKVRQYAANLGVKYVEEDIGPALIQAVMAPRHGHGKNMNPCIDCRILCMQQAKRYLDTGKADFVVTGEVVGERPMSQRRNIMVQVARESGIEDRVLRPLSAKLLPVTAPERGGLVDREQLGAISGRSRKPQMAMAEEFGLTDYPSPAGGCLLTEALFCARLKEAVSNGEVEISRDVEILKVGRHFRLPGGVKVVIGRNYQENLFLDEFRKPGEVLVEPVSVPGPSALVLASPEDPDLAVASSREPDLATVVALVARYTKPRPVNLEVKVFSGSAKNSVDRLDGVDRVDSVDRSSETVRKESFTIGLTAPDDEELESWRI